jgi:alkanesulfonate monooxygenase SsuD/methylene tetrahydromethanopterin reductase-like flavin-dependent oxidoreductase (luciferase family)
MALPLRCGVYLPNFGPFGDARTLAAIAADAERAGWDGFFVWDHIARPFATDMVDPWVALAAVAVATERIRIGALVTPLARRRPWKVARETVSIDRLSGGRLIFGAGLGSGRAAEWEDLGETADARTRATLLDEGLDVLGGLWRAERFSYEGEVYRVRDAEFAPAPVQNPRIPVWIAGHWPNRRPFRRAARWDGVFPEFPRGGDELAQLGEVVEYVRAQRASTAAFDVVYSSGPEATPDRLATIAAAGATWWLARIEAQYFGADGKSAWPMAAMRARIAAGPTG